ncbi:hypothetical protein FFLO_01842 [Filobasidium floriforme]|uniref:Sphingoid long-chain base transporter RSB1 n=1 Tax=Filobasidium floriforme TaxID=5210 RepID=A0A8K0NUH8_9TREE|nr:hypothetical protein FFLO_01842 [Filobasidium floriforme]
MSTSFDPYMGGCSPGNSSCNYVPGSINPFEGDVEYDFYGYNIQLYTAAIFVAFFGLTTLAHLVLGLISRQPWTLLTFFLGTLGELIGWSARLIASRSVEWDPSEGGVWRSNRTAFMAQIAVLIFSPAFLQAGCYIALGRIIPVLGPKYAFVHPLSYTVLFVVGDIVSLVVQAIGGGTAASGETLEEANRGGYIMLGGVIFQLVIMLAFMLVLGTFVWRFRTDRPCAKQVELFKWWPQALRTRKYKTAYDDQKRIDSGLDSGIVSPQSTNTNVGVDAEKAVGKTRWGGRGKSTSRMGTKTKFGSAQEGVEYTEKEIRGAKILLAACVVATFFIFIRSIYRSIELSEGWNGKIIENQTLFNLLDGMLILLATFTFIFVHPVWVMPRSKGGAAAATA